MQATLSPAVADTPFRLQIAPGNAVAHLGWRQARVAALAALDQGEAVALLGSPGTGKSLLLRSLAQALRHEGRSVRLVERGDALDPTLAAEVLLVDEAGRMGADALARLCMANKPLVLAVLPGFEERLAGWSRPITTVALEPLPPEEVARFVAARLSAAGRPRDLLEPDAVLALARHSAGLPRRVNVLGGAALFLAEMEQAPRVSQRHVDEAAAMRDGEGEGEAAAVPVPSLPEPITAIPPHAEAPAASHVPLPARRRRRAVLAVAAAGLGLVLAGGWAVSGWRPVQAPEARTSASNGPGADARNKISGQVPGAQPEVGRVVEIPRGDVARPALSEHQPAFRRTVEASPPSRASTILHQRPAVPAVPVSFRGAVYNETMRQGGQMSLVITREGPAGAVTAHFEAWGGLLGSGELAGHLAEDGRLSVSGPLIVGKNLFDCDLSGTVAGNTLTGSASFVRSSSGRVARSRFTLTRS